ncbi:Acyl-CoA dehydrogenase/oxidase, N-terminal [Dillenia turbinata]|uniref:Acyl-CoA dehydrogenase/oxidase, N-terminal n=1 Tax=Dillenia turbinata TaxID=194707 RepID=A0AAN8VIS6_9MAGN
MEEHIYPMENKFYKLARWIVLSGLENCFLVRQIMLSLMKAVIYLGAGFSNLEYGYLREIVGRSVWAPQVFNCEAPHTGNMEVLLRYGNKEQMQEWLSPLLKGKIREGDSYVINGTKWWTSGAMDPRCRILVVMGKTDFNATMHKQQSMILVDCRLGPGRLHHCMRLIGAAERGMQLMAQRALSRKCRVELEKTRLLILEAANQLDRLGNKKAQGTVAMAKVAAPNMALQVLDLAMQVHGAVGLSSDTVLSHLWATARTLRIADAPMKSIWVLLPSWNYKELGYSWRREDSNNVRIRKEF